MANHIEYTEKCWNRLLAKIRTDYPLSVTTIRSRMRAVLGFTVREHQKLRVSDKSGRTYYDEPIVCLDFYDEHKKTMFLMKYSEFPRVES